MPSKPPPQLRPGRIRGSTQRVVRQTRRSRASTSTPPGAPAGGWAMPGKTPAMGAEGQVSAPIGAPDAALEGEDGVDRGKQLVHDGEEPPQEHATVEYAGQRAEQVAEQV